MKEKCGLYFLIIVAVLLNILFLVGQTASLFSYDFTVSIGLQESISEVTEVGVAWAKGFAFADTIFYMPLFATGIIGMLKNKLWGFYSMFGALAISVYWPICSLFAIYAGEDALSLTQDKYLSYSILLPMISAYGLWGMCFVYKYHKKNVSISTHKTLTTNR